jgi:hypothetical protein
VRAELLNTDAYVATMAPLASSPAVQNAIATDISNQLAAKVDVQAKVKDALPPSAASLAAPLASQLQSFTYNAAKRVVSSDRFQSRWVSINRNAHFGRPSPPGDSAGTETQPTPADPAAPSPTAATGMDHSADATPATHGPSE